jgi:hypothetical protein
MPTCCVCHGYYPDRESVETFRRGERSASKAKSSPPPPPPNGEAKALPAPSEKIECPRCGSDNQNWEKARRGEFGDLLNRMTTRGLLALTPILLEVTIFLFMGAGLLVGLEFRKSEILLAMFMTILSIVLAWLCFAWRFRAREDFFLRSIAPAKRSNTFRILSLAPVVGVLVTMIWVVLYYVAGYLSADKVAQFPWSSISSPRMILFILYILLGSVTPYAMLATARRYVDSFDLPQPIFLNVPLMCTIMTGEYIGKPWNTVKQLDIEYREITRTPDGGLATLVNWQIGDRIRKSRIECDKWARLLSAKEVEKPY